jgi:hypothetical protein
MPDLSAAPVADLASARDLTPALDLTQAPPDLAPQKDLAKPSCVGTGGDCTYHNNSVCCSNYCTYSTNTCR